MDSPVRYEHFAPGHNGERQLCAFWIAGPLSRIERRALRENALSGSGPTAVEIALALAIALAALATVAGLV